MVTENDIREFDEAMTGLVRTMPTLLWSMFIELQGQGFTESQALELTKEYIKAFCKGN